MSTKLIHCCHRKSSEKIGLLVTQKSSTKTGRQWHINHYQKTKSLVTHKSSATIELRMTHGIVSESLIYYWLRNHQWKLSHFRLRNRQRKWIHGKRMEFSVNTVHCWLKIISENWVAINSEIFNNDRVIFYFTFP